MGDIRKRSMPLNFLSLGPVTSGAQPQASKPQDRSQPARRTSSMDSDKPTFKILKLGPVHLGEHIGEHKEDWHEVAVE